MQIHRFSPYEYLAFIFPGINLLFVLFYGWYGWPYGEPGVASLIGIVSAAFVTGHAISAIANWVEPVYWGEWPGKRVPSSKGLFGKGGLYDTEEQQRIESTLSKALPSPRLL